MNKDLQLPSFEALKELEDEMEKCAKEYKFFPIKEWVYSGGKYKIYLEKESLLSPVRLRFECLVQAQGLVKQNLYNEIVAIMDAIEEPLVKLGGEK